MARSVRSRFEKDIQSAIPLIRVDPHSADVMLTRIHTRARRAGDRKAALWALQLLQMLVGVSGDDAKRYLKICKEIARQDGRPMSWVFLGEAEIGMGNKKGAIAAFARAYADAGNDKETASLASDALTQLGAPPKANGEKAPAKPAKRPAKKKAARRAAAVRH
jgi:predicted Zn-dependent protease